MHEPCAVSLYVIVADDAIDDTLEMEDISFGRNHLQVNSKN